MLTPSHRLILSYDVQPDRFQQYYLYIRGEFVPTLQKLGLHMIFAWQVHGEGQPGRQIEFICESGEILCQALQNERFQHAEERLKSYTTQYQRKVVRFKNRFQF